MATPKVSPLEAIDLAYDYPLKLPEHLRATLAYLARHYPNIYPKRATMALQLGIPHAAAKLSALWEPTTPVVSISQAA